MQLFHSRFGTVVAGPLDIGRLHVRDVGHFVGNITGLDYPSLVYHRRGSLQPFTALSIVPWQARIRLVNNSFSTGAGSVYTGRPPAGISTPFEPVGATSIADIFTARNFCDDMFAPTPLFFSCLTHF
jgi:hypothetical protein